jgi:hypothetical protein
LTGHLNGKATLMAPTRTSTHRPSFPHHLLDRPAVRSGGRAASLLSTGLAFATVAAAAPSLFFPELLGGTEVFKGNLRGTALVMLSVGLPLLVAGMIRTGRNSARWLVLWLGACAYLTYQGVLLLFATPFNSLFLAYVAVLGFGTWSLVALVASADADGFMARTHPAMPVRFIGGMCLTIGALNALAWLARIAPTIGADDPADVLDGSGLLTNPVWVQDLAIWIPAAVVAGTWMWHRRPRGVLLGGAVLVLFTIESTSIAVDQWWGVRADDSQPDWASMTLVPTFLVAALFTALPLVWYFRNIDKELTDDRSPLRRFAAQVTGTRWATPPPPFEESSWTPASPSRPSRTPSRAWPRRPPT